MPEPLGKLTPDNKIAPCVTALDQHRNLGLGFRVEGLGFVRDPPEYFLLFNQGIVVQHPQTSNKSKGGVKGFTAGSSG